MARPRYEKSDETARERIVAAFWEELGETPFEKISTRGLISRAGLNKNTFYYHFENIDALAQEAIGNALPRKLAESIASGTVLQDAESRESGFLSSEAVLLLSPNGSALRPILAREMAKLWSSLMEARGIEVDAERRTLLSFIANGLIGAIGESGPNNALKTLSLLLNSGIVAPIASHAFGQMDRGK